MSEDQQNDPMLLTNLGTDPVDMAQGKIDMRRFGVHDRGDEALYIYAKMRAPTSRFWRLFYGEKINLGVGIDGRGRRDSIHGESVHKGAPANIQAEIHRPNWVERNITRRNWEAEEKRRLGIPDEQPATA